MSDEVKSPHGETICIRTNRIHDWCFSSGTASFTISDLCFPANTTEIAGVECAVTGAACAEIERNQACGDVAVVTLRKQVTFTLTFVDACGNPIPITRGSAVITTQTRTRFFDEFVQVCAPAGSTVHCEITNAGCRATLDGVSAVTVELFLCQSIRVESEVNVCINIVDFCVPDVCEKRSMPFACPPSDCLGSDCDSSEPCSEPPCGEEQSGDCSGSGEHESGHQSDQSCGSDGDHGDLSCCDDCHSGHGHGGDKSSGCHTGDRGHGKSGKSGPNATTDRCHKIVGDVKNGGMIWMGGFSRDDSSGGSDSYDYSGGSGSCDDSSGSSSCDYSDSSGSYDCSDSSGDASDRRTTT